MSDPESKPVSEGESNIASKETAGASRVSQRGVPAVVRRVLHSGRVWIIQGVGTLLLFGLAYVWLWIHEARWWQLAGSLVLAMFLVYLAAFLQRTALRVYRRDRLDAEGRKAAAKPPRRSFLQWFPGAAFVFVLFVALAWAGGALEDALPDATQFVGSWLTLHLRRPVNPYVLQERLESAKFVGVWFLFVVLWLPLAAASLLGESGMFRAAARAWRRLRYWLATLVCTAVGHFAFWKLAEWVPKATSIAGQTASMTARLAAGYVIALGAWLVILALVEEAIAGPPARSPDDTWDVL
ncbi:MAG TPA: hypothetical protein VKG84_00725 [Candidatus Acidoferrales bacterium]|nr:hypothetical protein [Candidatus Acidoferrales bacterium]